MSKQQKNIVLIAVLLLVLNFVSSNFYKRFDLTKDKRYTLTTVTTDLLDELDSQLIVRVYLEGDFPSEFKRLQIETKQFLEELKAKNNAVKVQFIDPTDYREQLVKSGMTPSQLTVEENGKLSNAIIFPWAEVIYQNKKANVSLLPTAILQTQEQQLEAAVEGLEHSFSTAIKTVSQTETKKIAVLSGNGELEDIQIFSFLKEVNRKYGLAKFTLDSVQNNPNQVLNNLKGFDLAIIAKPTEQFTEEEKLVLDQFIIQGGKTLWMLENVQADTDSLYNDGKMLAYPRDLNLTDLLFSYGVRINNAIIKDLYSSRIALATGNVGNQAQFQNLPWFYHPLVSGNPNHPITKNLSPVRLRFANQIDTLNNGIAKTPLLLSSPLTRKVGTPSMIELQSIEEEPKEEDYKAGFQLFGVLLEGEFNSAYANRIKPFDNSNFQKKSATNKMVIISDGDIGRNQIAKGQPYDLGVDKWTGEQFGNKEFLINTVDYLLDDSGLISLRNKTLNISYLDKQKAFKERTKWQLINVVAPIALLLAFGFTFNYLRKRNK